MTKEELERKSETEGLMAEEVTESKACKTYSARLRQIRDDEEKISGRA